MEKKNNLIYWLKRILAILFVSVVLFFIVLIFGFHLMSHPPQYELSFKVNEQKLVECNSRQLLSFSIENDSITKDNGAYEMTKIITWDNEGQQAPYEFSFKDIPEGYSLFGYKNNTSLNKLELKPNCSYTIEQYGGGGINFKIRIWTDSSGRVYKTTHPVCGLKSLEEKD